MKINNKFIYIFTLVLFSPESLSYIGPGMAGGAIAAILGIVASIFLAIFGVIYLPTKRALKKKKYQNRIKEDLKL